MPTILNTSGESRPNPQAVVLVMPDRTKQHLRKIMLVGDGVDVVWQKHCSKISETKDLSLESLEYQGIKLKAANQLGNLSFPMLFPPRLTNDWQEYRGRLTFIGDAELSLQSIDAMLEADVAGSEMLFPMFFFGSKPPQDYDFRRKLTFIAKNPTELALESIDAMLVAEVKNSRSMYFPMVFPANKPTSRVESLGRLTFIPKRDIEIELDFVKDFEFEVCDALDFVKDFDIDVYDNADFVKDFDIWSYGLSDFTKDFSIKSNELPSFIQDFDINAYYPAKDFISDFTVNAYDPTKDFTKEFIVSIIPTVAFEKDFSINAFDPAKDFTKDFPVNAVDTKNDFVKNFTASAIQTVDFNKTFTVPAIQIIDYTKDFTITAFRTVDYTKNFSVPAIIMRDYTKDFALAVSRFERTGIIWANTVGFQTIVLGIHNLPSTLPRTNERLLLYSGIILMNRPHQWFTGVTAEDVRRDIIRRNGHTTFSERSVTLSTTFPRQTYPRVDVARELGQIQCLVVVSRGGAHTASTEPHWRTSISVNVGMNQFGEGGTSWHTPVITM
jgi:hypothetical protein